MKKLDKFGLCLEEYTNNKNNPQVYIMEPLATRIINNE